MKDIKIITKKIINMRDIQTVEKFLKGYDPIDGHYVIWKSGMFSDPREESNGQLYGFSGAVVEYNNMEGFKNYPDWFEDTEDWEVNIMLIEPLPSVSELMDDF
jgi:hypothetical protein